MALLHSLNRLLKDENAISSVEYALILGVIGAAIAVAALGLGDSVVDRTNEASAVVEASGN